MTKIFSAALCMTFLTCAAASAATVTAKFGPASRVWLEGDSSLHPYSSTATAVKFELTLEAADASPRALAAAIEAQAPAKMTVRIPAASLKSGHKTLDKNMRKALREPEHPEIVFVLKGYTVAKGTAAQTLTATGDLSVAGKTKPETLTAALSAKEGRAVLDGEQPLLMSDFGVKPPAMMFGAIKTNDRVVVKFHVELEDETR